MLRIKLSDKQRQIGLYVLAGLFLLAISVGLKSCYDNRIISQHETEVKAKTLEENTKANDAAATRRSADAIINHNKDEERKDAISKETDGPPSDASIALGCTRLRQAGKDTTSIPACRGR